MVDGQRSAALYGLRGLSALGVALHHLYLMGLAPLGFPIHAKLCVWIFFAHSAYLLTGKLADELRASSGTRERIVASYATRRIFRIFPAYLAILAFMWATGEFSSVTLLKHVALMDGRGIFWAIPVEFKFYALIPLVAALAAIDTRSALGLLLGLGLASTLVSVEARAWIFNNGIALGPKLVPFVAGSALALSWNMLPKTARPVLALGALGLADVFLRFEQPRVVEPAISLVASVGAVLILHAASVESPIQRVLAWRPIALLGEISFPLYITHMIVFRFAGFYAPTMPLAVLTLGSIAGSIALAYAIHVAIERPGMTAGQRLGARLVRASVPAASLRRPGRLPRVSPAPFPSSRQIS